MNLGIDNLISSLQKLQTGSVYFLSTSSQELAMHEALTCLHENSYADNLRYLTLQGIDADFIKSLNLSKKFLSDIKAHVYEYENKANVLKTIIDDLSVYNALDENSLQVIVFDDSYFWKEQDDNIRRYLSKISYFAQKFHTTFLFISYGSDAETTTKKLLEHSTKLSGVASLEQNLNSYVLNSRLWRLEDGGYTNGVNLVIPTDEGIKLVIDENSSAAIIDDDTCYLVANSFTPDSKYYPNTKVFVSNKELYEKAIEDAYCATIFFTLESRSNIDELASMIYNLRTIRGKDLKIIILEIIPGIRATSERLLIRCGANFIFPSSAKGYYINAMIPTLKTIRFNDTISVPFDEILRNYRIIENEGNGYLSPSDFFNNVLRLLKIGYENNYVEACLTILTPKNGIDSLSALSQFAPKRSGDYCTLLNGNLAVFLPNCRNGEIKIALLHAFNTDPAILFESDEAYFTKRDIITKLHELSEQKIYSELDKETIQKLIGKRKMISSVNKKEVTLMSLATTSYAKATLTDIALLKKKENNSELSSHI